MVMTAQTTNTGLIGHNRPDPLLGWTRREIFTACVWLADLSTSEKIFLLCVGRFFDDNACSSSMSYSQVARECGLHESTAKKIAKAVVDVWVKIEIGKGQLTSRGPQNLYHGIIPTSIVEDLRTQLRGGALGVSLGDPEGSGVASGNPMGSHQAIPEASKGSPTIQMGSPQATRTSLSLNKQPDRQGSPRETPHLNGKGFIVSAEHDLVIPAEEVEAFRQRYPFIPDLDATMTSLATSALAKGRTHAIWQSPGGWMMKPLSEINAKSLEESKLAEARLSRAAKGSGPHDGSEQEMRTLKGILGRRP